MNKLTDKEKKLLFILLLVVVSVVCIRFILMPDITSYRELKMQVQTGREKLSELQIGLAQGEAIQGKIEEIAVKVDEASKPFLPVVSQEIIQKWLIREAKKANLNLSSLTISEPIIQVVTPYKVSEREAIEVSYPIGQLYEEMMAILGATAIEEELPMPAEAAAPEPTEAIDQVMKTTINMTFTAQQEDFIRFLNNIKAMDRHFIVENVPLGSFKTGSSQEVSITLSMYSIHKNNDDIFKG